MLFSLQRNGLTVKAFISSYLPIQEKFNFCFIADQQICELWAFVYIMSKRLYAIDLISSLYVLKGDTRKNLPSNDFPYSWQTR